MYSIVTEGQEWDEAENPKNTQIVEQRQQQSQFGITPIQVLSCRCLTSTEKSVYAAIASHLRGAKTTCFPSYNRIAGILGISRRTVIRAVKHLQENNFLNKKQEIRPDGGYTSNRYTLVTSQTPHSDLNDTNHSDITDTPTSDLNDTTNNRKKNNNNLIKLNKLNKRAQTRLRNASADSLLSADQTDLEDFVQNPQDLKILQYMKSLANRAVAWVELVRQYKTYFVRPISPFASKFYNQDDFDHLVGQVKEKAGSCQALQYGQHLANEIEIKE